MQAGRADLFARLDQQLDVEAEPTAARSSDALEGGEHDTVLAFVVGGAAAIPAIAFDGERPRSEWLAPLLLIASNNVAMSVDENGRKLGAFVPRRNEHGPMRRDRVVDDSCTEPAAYDRCRDFVGEIAPQHGPTRVFLAFGAIRDAPREIGVQHAGVEIVPRVGERP